MITEKEELTIKIAALKRRIKSENNFIQRQLAIQRNGKGIVNAVSYNSLAKDAKNQHKKKRKSRGGLRRNFFTWDWAAFSPYEIIKRAKNRLATLELRLKEL